jgi:loader and inhibitor of G40P protein
LNRLEVTQLLTMFEAIYPHWKVPDSREKAEINVGAWLDFFEPYPAQVVKQAVREHVKKGKFAPAIAEIYDEVQRIVTPDLFASPDESFELLMKAVRDVGVYPKLYGDKLIEAHEIARARLDTITWKVVERLGGWSRAHALCNTYDDAPTHTKGQFAAIYKAVVQREKSANSVNGFEQLLGGQDLKQIEPPTDQPNG